MQKGALNGELKKNPPPDNDFGKDFFDSWKNAKLGNDSIDFEVDALPKNKKASFKFDELDNFELSGNFNKLSSLKLDVPDLDFTLHSKKNEKAHEKSSKEIATEKRESKEDKFSFDFDFKSFDFDTKSPEDKRPSNLFDKKVQEHSSNHETSQESSDNISTSNNILKDISLSKGGAVAEENEKKTSVIMAQRKHPVIPAKSSGNNQDFSLQTSSDDGSEEITPLGIQTVNAPLNVANPRQMPICSSPAKSSSPVDSYNSGYWTKASGKGLLNSVNEIQKHQSQETLTRKSGSLTDLFEIKREAYCSTRPKTTFMGVGEKNIDERHNPCQNITLPYKEKSHQNLMQPPLKREFRVGGSTKLCGLMGTGLQLHTISELENDFPQQSPALKIKPFNSVMEVRTKITQASINNESSLLFQPSNASCQTSLSAKSILKPSLQKLSTDASIDLKGPSTENRKPNLVSSTKLDSQIKKVDKDTSLGDNSHCGTRNSSIAKTNELNNNRTNSLSRESKSVHFLEKKMECPLNPANPVSIEKHASPHASLKRKIDEETLADLRTSSPLKFFKESTTNRRISVKAPQNTKSKMVPETKTTETCEDITPVTILTAATEIGNQVAGFSSNLEDDNPRNAETYIKGLDNIGSMLRKKRDEAKELQVRSIINNNALLLLNWSMLEENIQELQKFATSLLEGI